MVLHVHSESTCAGLPDQEMTVLHSDKSRSQTYRRREILYRRDIISTVFQNLGPSVKNTYTLCTSIDIAIRLTTHTASSGDVGGVAADGGDERLHASSE